MLKDNILTNNNETQNFNSILTNKKLYIKCKRSTENFTYKEVTMATTLLFLLALCIMNTLGKVKVGYRRWNQHVTINRDGTDVDLHAGEVVKVNGRRMAYIGNKQWIAEDSSGNWDFSQTQYMPSTYFLTIKQFEKTGTRLSSKERKDLGKTLKDFGDQDDEDNENNNDSNDDGDDTSEGDMHGTGFLNSVGYGVKIFLFIWIGGCTAVFTFCIAAYIGYYGWDYNLRKLSKVLNERAMNMKHLDNKHHGYKHKSEKINMIPNNSV